MKNLQEILDVQNHEIHTDPNWAKAGYGPTSYLTVKGLLGKNPVSTDATDHPMNIDQDFKKKLMMFFDTLGEIMLQDYPHDTSVFDAIAIHGKDGHRPADRHVGESLENFQEIAKETLTEGMHPVEVAFELIDEAILAQDVGKLFEALVSYRGVQRQMKVFMPTTKAVTLRKLQESIGKVLSGAVVLKYSPLMDNRVHGNPLIILEADARFIAEDNVILDTATDTFLVLEKKNCDSAEMKASGGKKKKKRAVAPMVKEAFDKYRERLISLEEDDE